MMKRKSRGPGRVGWRENQAIKQSGKERIGEGRHGNCYSTREKRSAVLAIRSAGCRFSLI